MKIDITDLHRLIGFNVKIRGVVGLLFLSGNDVFFASNSRMFDGLSAPRKPSGFAYSWWLADIRYPHGKYDERAYEVLVVDLCDREVL